MKYQQHQLENGLTILADANAAAYTTAFGFFVRTGARDETKEIGGVSHFLEHMVFKGTPNRTAEQVNLQLDEMGSSSNARTGEEATIYHSSVLPEFQTPMVELLSDILRPSLRDSDFDTEKQVIIEEIMMYQDQPPYGGYEKSMELFFGSHGLGQSVLGTVESVGGLTPSQMKDYFKVRYSPSNIALVASGCVDFDQLIRDAESFCGSWDPFSAERKHISADCNFGFETLHKPNSHQQYILQLAPGPTSNILNRYALRVAIAILGDDGGSRMYWKFLDPGLAESAGAGSYEYLDNGLVMSYVCCAPEDAQRNLKILKDIQLEFQEKGVTEKELELAKQKFASQIVLASEKTENRMFSMGAQWLSGQEFKTVQEIAEIYQNITLDEVNQAIQDYPLDQNMTLAIGPNDALEPA